MKYNFDEVIDRKNTSSIKFDFAAERGKPEGVLPFWVADMDFKSPPEVIAELTKRCEHGIYGYTDPKEDYFLSVQNWFARRHLLPLEKEWIVVTAGVVFAINCAIRAFTREGDGVLVQRPVYYPFFKSVIKNKRRVVNNPLVNRGGRYEIDFEDFENKIVNENVKMFILCSPHNPVGRVWTADELKKMGGICKEHGVIVVSDEIHSEFTFGVRHTPYWLADSGLDGQSILCTSASKAFNQAGLQHANILIQNPELRRKFIHETGVSGFSNVSTFGMFACKAAYDYGEQWICELNVYLKENIDFANEFLARRVPQVRTCKIEGTYLLWMDFRALGLPQAELDKLMVEKANLWLDGGTIFGPEGEGYQRINIATTRKNVRLALENIEKAVNNI